MYCCSIDCRCTKIMNFLYFLFCFQWYMSLLAIRYVVICMYSVSVDMLTNKFVNSGESEECKNRKICPSRVNVNS